MKVFVLLLAAALGTGCASTSPGLPPLPDWVENPEKSYPRDRFLTSVGSGASRDEAIRDARRQMAEIFQTRVQTVTKVKSDTSFTRDTGGAQSGKAEQGLSRESTFETDVKIRGAEVRETFETGGSFHALLVLDKLAARSALLLEANQAKMRIEGALDALEESPRMNLLQEAKFGIQRLNAYASDASVLGLGALVEVAGLERRYQQLEAELRLRNSKKIFTVETVQGDGQFARELEMCLQDLGAAVVVKEKAGDSAHRISVSVSEQPEHLAVEGWVKIRFEVSAVIAEPSGKSHRFSDSRTETARSRDAGLALAVERLSRNLCEKAWGRIVEIK